MQRSTSKTTPLSLKANTLWNAFGCLFYLGCQWLTTVIVVVLSSDYQNSGILAFAMATGNMFASIGLYKIRTFQVSDVTGEYSQDNYVAFRLVTVAMSFLITTCYLVLTNGVNLFSLTSVVYLLFKADEVFVDVFFGVEQSAERMDYIGKSQLMRGFATLIGFSVPLFFTKNLFAAIIGMTILCIATTIIYDRRNARLFGYRRPRITPSIARALLRACLLPTIANLLATSIVSIARQRYGMLCGVELLGMYASIATPAVLVQAAATYLYSPLIGRLAQARLTGHGERFPPLFAKVLAALIACIVLGTLVLTCPGEWLIVRIFGQNLAPYTNIFPFVLMSTGSVALLYYINDVFLVIRSGASQLIINALALGISTLSLHPFVEHAAMNGVNLAIILGCSIASLLGIALIVRLSHEAPKH